MSNPLIAPVESTRKPWTGSSLADGIQGVVESIQNKSWVDGILSGAGLAVDVTASVMDPISALLANGIGWAMEYFEPLRKMLDELTGMPDVVASHAATWNNIATELGDIAADLDSELQADLPDWDGKAASAYHEMMFNNVEATGALSAAAGAISAATQAAGN